MSPRSIQDPGRISALRSGINSRANRFMPISTKSPRWPWHRPSPQGSRRLAGRCVSLIHSPVDAERHSRKLPKGMDGAGIAEDLLRRELFFRWQNIDQGLNGFMISERLQEDIDRVCSPTPTRIAVSARSVSGHLSPERRSRCLDPPQLFEALPDPTPSTFPLVPALLPLRHLG
jgi:hypothetical protein